jgi:hypothetical protein
VGSDTVRGDAKRLEEIESSTEWLGSQTYRALSYYFTIRWNWADQVSLLRRILSPFEVPLDPNEERSPPIPGMPPIYSLLDLGEGSQSRYRLRFSGGDLIRSDKRSDPLLHLLWHINAEAFRRTGDFLLIHAGAVVAPSTRAAILLPGGTGSGKTTLVAALISEGFDYLSDEAAAIDPVSHLVYPFPRALAFKQGSWDVVASSSTRFPVAREDGSIGDQRHVLAEEVRPSSLAGPSPLRTIVSVKYEAGCSTEITPLTRAAAAVRLAEGALNLRIYRERGIKLIGRVVRNADCYQMTGGDLSEAVDAISNLPLSSTSTHRG